MHEQVIVKDTAYRSPLRYPGGKQRAISRIAPMIQMLPDDINEYREPMVGGASVYLYARSVGLANKYWINDKFTDLVVFWQTAQDPKLCAKLQRKLTELRKRLATPALIKEFYYAARDRTPRDDFETALLFFFFNRVSFSGTTQAGGFSAAAGEQRFTQSSIDRLAPLPNAFAETLITNHDYSRVVKKAGKDVFLFLDPPYFTASKLYGRDGTLHDFPHQELADLLKQTKHKFLITYDDCQSIRDMYKWANMRVNMKEWSLTYGMNNCNSDNTCKIGAELFISNY